ncbi:MAG: ABC transporter permease [Truepera sp.]|nr:ABC transporter permease [Truepera sp.]
MESTDLSADARSGPRRRWLKSLLRSPVGLLGVILVGAAVLMAVGAPLIAPLSPMEFNFRSRLLPPSWLGGEPGFFLGTDQLGRDLLSRLIFGARISLLVGVLGVLISLLIGVTLGLISGYVGGLIDSFISRVIDTFMAIPFILLALAVVGVVGTSGGNSLTILVVVLGLTGWVTFARVVRGEVLSVKNLEYVEAANALGQRDFLVIFRHVLPNVTASIIVLATLQIATVIIAESSLSFLGLGVQPPTVTWGIMLADGRDYLATSWWLSTFPGIAITLTTLGMILLGDWLRDVLDPRMVT